MELRRSVATRDLKDSLLGGGGTTPAGHNLHSISWNERSNELCSPVLSKVNSSLNVKLGQISEELYKQVHLNKVAVNICSTQQDQGDKIKLPREQFI